MSRNSWWMTEDIANDHKEWKTLNWFLSSQFGLAISTSTSLYEG